MKDFLKELVKDSYWRVTCFNGQVLFEGRILTPAEAERAGLASSLIAAQIVKEQPKNKKSIDVIADKAQKGEELNDLEQEQLIGFISSLRPEQLTAITDQEDKILCQVVKRGSSDGGSTWDPVHLVTGVDQQNPDTGCLWVGMLSKDDRAAIINAAMTGHEEAAEKAASFRK